MAADSIDPAVLDRVAEVFARARSVLFDLVVSIGTTSVFPYIAAPVVRASRAGHATVEINPGTTAVSHVVGAPDPQPGRGRARRDLAPARGGQVLSFLPVRNTQATNARQIARKPSVAAKLIVGLTSDWP